MITLYQYPGGDGLSSLSPPCVKVELALRYVGAEHRVVNLRPSRDVRRLSSTGRVPVVDFDGVRVGDSVAILDELERKFSASDLFPKEEPQRSVDRLWEHFVNDHLYWLGFTLRWSDEQGRARFFDAAFGRLPLPARLAVRAVLLPRMRKRALAHGAGAKTADERDRDIERGLDMLERGLADGRFLQGRAAPGRGDLAAASLLIQLGFRRSAPEWQSRIERRARIRTHACDVLDVCGMKRPRWLA